MYTQSGQRFRIVIGLDGGVYVCRWTDSMRRHSTPYWHVLAKAAP